MSDADFSRASTLSTHFPARARMGLRGGVRARFDTVSSTEHRSPNAVGRGRRRNLIQHGHRPPLLIDRVSQFLRRRYLCSSAWTLSICSDSQQIGFHEDTHTSRVRVFVKTAMEKKQTRECERYMRLIARVRVASRQKKFLLDPLREGCPHGREGELAHLG